MVMVVSTSSKVAAKVSRISSFTGRSVSSDRPRSPCARPAMKRPYCSTSGRFSPSFAAQRLDLLLAGARPERQARRIAGDGPGDREDDDRQAEQHQQRPQHPSNEEKKEFQRSWSRSAVNVRGESSLRLT